MDIPESKWKDNTSSLTEKELTKLVSSNINEVSAIMADILTNLTTLKDQAKKIRDVVNQLPQSLENGVSLLDLKSQFMLSYNELLLVCLLLKIEGVGLQDHPLFASLVRERLDL